jgi:hypothetical protein
MKALDTDRLPAGLAAELERRFFWWEPSLPVGRFLMGLLGDRPMPDSFEPKTEILPKAQQEIWPPCERGSLAVPTHAVARQRGLMEPRAIFV